MNIFVFDLDAQKTVEQICDEDLQQACYCYTRMLCDVHHFLTPAVARTKSYGVPYPPFDLGDPGVDWLAQSDCNYLWFFDYWKRLMAEYQHRRGKTHGCWRCKDKLQDLPLNIPGKHSTHTVPPLKMKPEYISAATATMKSTEPWQVSIEANRVAYIQGKIGPRWSNRPVPKWYLDATGKKPVTIISNPTQVTYDIVTDRFLTGNDPANEVKITEALTKAVAEEMDRQIMDTLFGANQAERQAQAKAAAEEAERRRQEQEAIRAELESRKKYLFKKIRQTN